MIDFPVDEETSADDMKHLRVLKAFFVSITHCMTVDHCPLLAIESLSSGTDIS